MKILFWLLLGISIFFEGTRVSMPVTINVLLLSYVIARESFVFVGAVIAGIILDLILARTIGVESLLFLMLLFLVVLYERKFEIQTIPFIFLSSLAASSLVFVLHYNYFSFLPVFSMAFLAVFGFRIALTFKVKKINIFP